MASAIILRLPEQTEADMPTTVNIYEAKTRLSELVELAAKGEDIVIAKAGRPKARLIAAVTPKRRLARKLGGWEGKVWTSGDFDAPLPPDQLAYFTGESTEDDHLFADPQ